MNEVEKMYENAEPDRNCNLYKHFTECPMKHTQCEDCENFVYPPFTAEKQLKIVKMILFSTWWLNLKRLQFSEKFDEGLAQMINELWQDLTPEEKASIKNILEM